MTKLKGFLSSVTMKMDLEVTLFCISEFIGIFWIDVNLHFSCQMTFLLAFVAVVCISEFIGISWIDVNLHISCQMALLLAFVAVVCISEFIGIF